MAKKVAPSVGTVVEILDSGVKDQEVLYDYFEDFVANHPQLANIWAQFSKSGVVERGEVPSRLLVQASLNHVELDSLTETFINCLWYLTHNGYWGNFAREVELLNRVGRDK